MISSLRNEFVGRLSRAAERWREAESGATATEFAMLSPVFIALILGSIQAAVMFIAKSELDLATQAAAREVMTQQVTTAAQLKTALCNNIGGIFNCSNLMINMQSYSTLSSMQTATPTLTYNANGTVSNSWSTNFGAASSLMVMQVMYQFPVFGFGPLFSFATQSNGTNLMISTAVFVNE
jgi:Flp pilus assembly protein TadG